ncbi:O-antigen ligase family protein [Candidatus Omnitrophota bacterium]
MLGIGLTKYIPVLIYSIFLISVFAALFYRTDLPFIFLVALLPLTNVLLRLQQFPLGKDLVDILLLAIFIAWLARSFVNKEKFLTATPFNKLLFILIIFTYFELWAGSAFVGIAAPISFDNLRFQDWKNYMILPLLFFITVNNIKDKKTMKRLVYAMVFIIFVMGLYFFKDYRWISKSVFRDYKRWYGTFAYLGPNEWAAFHVHYIFVMLGIFFIDKLKQWRLLFGAAILLSLYCILFAYSRGAYIALLIGLIFFSLMKKKRILIPVIILLLFWQILLPQAVVQRIQATKTEYGELDSSGKSRLDLWGKGLSLFSRNPLTGIGFATSPELGLRKSLTDTHNIYVEILVEQGIVGMIIFLLLIYLSLRSGWQLYKTADDTFLQGLGFGFVCCTLVLLITNFFGDRWTYLQLAAYYWVFLGLVVRGNIIVNAQRANSIPVKKSQNR